MRQLAAVTQTGTDQDVIWAQQAIDALLALKNAADAALAAGHDAIDPEILGKQSGYFRDAAAAGTTLNAARRSPLQKNPARPGHPDARPAGRLPAVRQ